MIITLSWSSLADLTLAGSWARAAAISWGVGCGRAGIEEFGTGAVEAWIGGWLLFGATICAGGATPG